MAEENNATPDLSAPAEPQQAIQDTPEALLTEEKLPLELPEEQGATPSQAEGGRPSQVLTLTNTLLRALHAIPIATREEFTMSCTQGHGLKSCLLPFRGRQP